MVESLMRLNSLGHSILYGGFVEGIQVNHHCIHFTSKHELHVMYFHFFIGEVLEFSSSSHGKEREYMWLIEARGSSNDDRILTGSEKVRLRSLCKPKTGVLSPKLITEIMLNLTLTHP